jgi:hypothetical protein
MSFISLATAFLMLWIFKRTSNQEGIHKAKNAIKAHLLELRLFKDNLRISLRAQRRILRANLTYLACNTKPFLVMIVPILLVLAQLNLWFGASPLVPGDKTLVKVKLAKTVDPQFLDLALEATPGLLVETPAVRIVDEHEIDWRIKALGTGPAALTFRVAGRTITKPVALWRQRLQKVSMLTVGHSIIRELLYPGENPLPGDTPVREIEVLYPAKSLNFFGISVHWLVVYFILSIIFGFAFKGVFKVEI